MRIILSLILIGIGTLLSLKATWLAQNLGAVEFGEKYLGGTRLFWKLFGILVIMVGALTMIGVTGNILRGFLGMFIRR